MVVIVINGRLHTAFCQSCVRINCFHLNCLVFFKHAVASTVYLSTLFCSKIMLGDRLFSYICVYKTMDLIIVKPQIQIVNVATRLVLDISFTSPC